MSPYRADRPATAELRRQKPAWVFVVSLWAAVPSVADRWAELDYAEMLA